MFYRKHYQALSVFLYLPVIALWRDISAWWQVTPLPAYSVQSACCQPHQSHRDRSVLHQETQAQCKEEPQQHLGWGSHPGNCTWCHFLHRQDQAVAWPVPADSAQVWSHRQGPQEWPWQWLEPLYCSRCHLSSDRTWEWTGSRSWPNSGGACEDLFWCHIVSLWTAGCGAGPGPLGQQTTFTL